MPPTLQTLTRSKFAPFVLEFQNVDSRPAKPLANAHVRVELLDAGGKSVGVLFQGRSNAQAKVAIRVPIPRPVEGQPPPPLPKVRITVLDLDGDEVHRQDVQPQLEKPIPIIKVSDEPEQKKILAPIGDGLPVLGRAVSGTLADRLKQGKVDSLAALRKADPATLSGLSGQDKQDLADLLAHAQLQLVSRNHKTNQALFKANYRSILDIDRQSRAEFAGAVKAQITEGVAEAIHETARRQVQVLKTLHAQKQARQANGMAPLSYGAPVGEAPCACDCNSAVSPQAYLVDLLDYASDNLRFEGDRIELSELERTFFQPFGAMPKGCEFAEQLVRQVRLAVEVLRRRSAGLPASPERTQAINTAVSSHTSRSYEALLRALGASYRELRLARSDEAFRKRLAERLGIAHSHVDRFRLEPDTGDVNLRRNEDGLERMFGLQGTTRDPLSAGAKFRDGSNQIKRWQLRGVEWRRNTDELGRIHVAVARAAGSRVDVTLYRDETRSNAVAKGTLAGNSGAVTVDQLNGSGLVGLIDVTYSQDDNNIYIVVVPEWVVRRKQHLRTQWQQADHPPSRFEAPIIDPDVVAESDFLKPFDANNAHTIWQTRSADLESKRQSLSGQGQPRALSDMFAEVFGAALGQPAWDTLGARLGSSTAAEVEAAKAQLRAVDPHLTSETFRFLLELWHREAGGPEVKPEERDQALDVLVHIYKARKFQQWRTEEATANIRLSPPFFYLSEAQPVLNPLRANDETRSHWRAELERNSSLPLIDPDIVAEFNFASDSDSTAEYQMWERRRQLVGDGRRAGDNVPPPVEGTLFQAVAGIDSAAKLDTALTSGDLPVGQPPLFHHVGLAAAELTEIDEALKKGANLPIVPEQYGLTAGEVLALFEVRQLAANADAGDWEQVHHILVQTEKRRYLYPQWRAEEETDGITLSPDIFFVPSDELAQLLPLLQLATAFLTWRRDARRQRGWKDQLAARIEQENAVLSGLRAAVDAAEEASLPALRDELVMATLSAETGGESLEERKRWVANNLLINAFENGCRKTTRVAQGIETVQLLLWGVHNRQFEDLRYSLEPDSAASFADEWLWLGSYATWRSAMFTYLYPENLLLPELRQDIGDWRSDPTKLFRAILKVVSGQATPTAQDGEGDVAEAESEQDSDELEQGWVDRIFFALGGLDPTQNSGKEKIFRKLPNWRVSILVGDNEFDRTQVFYRNHPILNNTVWWTYIPQRPALETNPMLVEWRDDSLPIAFEDVILRGDAGPNAPSPDDVACWAEYVTESAFLEDHLYIPLHFGLSEHRSGRFEEALNWYRRAYAYDQTPEAGKQGWTSSRLELYFQQRSANDVASYSAFDDWLSDSLNPHRIAATRTGAQARFVILSIIRCLLDYADSEFSKDNSESLARARELYESARRLLYSEILGKKIGDCPDLIGKLISEIGEDEWVATIVPELDRYQPPVVDPDSWGGRDRLVADIGKAIKSANPRESRAKIRQEVHTIVARHFAARAPKPIEKSLQEAKTTRQNSYQFMLTEPNIFQQLQRAGNPSQSFFPGLRGVEVKPKSGHWNRAPRVEFCIPRNPLIALLRMRFEVSWFKLNNCMNLAGQHREVPAYASPTDTYSGLPVAEVGSPASFSAAARLVPTQYRYRVLIERARQLVTMAQQMEATYLSLLEKRDQEAYTILRARQDLGIAGANVTLQDLRVTEAEDGKDLASLQFSRAEEAFEHYDDLIHEGLLGSEENALLLLNINVFLQGAVALLTTGGAIAAGLVAGGAIGIESGPGSFFTALGGGGGAAAAAMSLSQTAFSSATGALSTGSSILSMLASFERREEEWTFQRDLAEIDQDIAEAQQTMAKDRYGITVQEKRISEMNAQNASDVVNFLNAKFTNVELYAWMGGIVGGVYRYLLQEATTIAKLAQRQLAFERQETELAVVLDDYWTYTDTSAILRGGLGSADRRGMTGSARLLQDITRLDQEAFLTDRRKLQLSKTFSLALHDPIAFARFQESGVLPFSTTLEQFDRNFPGHYLRLIKRVRVSVIALVPPTEGIRATLSSSGISRVVRGGDTFSEIEIRRDPETIAFTSPINATGLFELQEQPEMLLPFEGNGVAATGWVFSMPRAANIVNYSTIADVLLTIEYTALESSIFRTQIIQQLDRTASGERPFSFRHQFADCWYDFNNPELLEDDRQMNVTFETRQSDFPPNVTDLRIEHVSLYFVRQDGFTGPIDVEHLLFTESGRAGSAGGAANTTDGLISTRNSNGGSWLAMQGKQPVGRWELKLPNTAVAKDWFKRGDVEDMFFVITFSGTTPAWPA